MNPYDDDTVDELPAPPRQDIPADDLKLLQLAARALGARFEEVDGEGYGNLHFPDGSVVYAWNSLQFSGDTFELQVKLGLRVGVYAREDEQFVAASPCRTLRRDETSTIEELGDDRLAAARRAVTRAAAEIGKAVPA